MRSMKMARMGAEDFSPRSARCITILMIEESTLGGLGKKLIRCIAIREEISVEFPETKLRGQQAACICYISVLQVGLIPTLMQVWRTWLGREGVQPVIAEFLWKDHEGCSGCLLLTDVEIELRIGIEGLGLGVALKGRQTRYRTPVVAVLEGLCECNPILHDGPGECHSGRYRSNAHNRSIESAKTRKQVLSRNAKLVEVAGASLDVR